MIVIIRSCRQIWDAFGIRRDYGILRHFFTLVMQAERKISLFLIRWQLKNRHHAVVSIKYEEKSFWCVDALENLTLKIDIFFMQFIISANNAKNIFLFK